MNLILLGAPGAGKGTQAEVICEKLSIPAISTGNILREAVKNKTQAGIAAGEYMESGSLVPDEVVINILRDRIAQADCKNGFILDGFPRTVPQAEALDKMGIIINTVINIEVTDEDIMQRLSGRRVCEKCGSSYHLQHKKPQTDNVCDKCASKLIQRKDDLPETIKSRLQIYHDQTEPLKDYYNNLGKLIEIIGNGTVMNTTAKVIKALEALK